LIWRVVARISSPGLRTTSFTGGRSFQRASTVSIALGPRRQLRCACGRTWVHLPNEAELPEDADTCNHIRALYWNGKIPAPTLGGMLKSWNHFIATVHLTELGQRLFAWRYAARALKDDT
jgi:hypothetical protein